MPAGLMRGFEDQRGRALCGEGRLLAGGRRTGQGGPTGGWEGLRFERDSCTSTTLHTLGLADKAGAQDNLESFACRFAELGGCSGCPRLGSECL